MADPITEFVIEFILSLVQNPFVDFSLLIGIVMFFLYFYKTKYWSKYNWTKRAILGFLMGFFSVSVLYVAILPLNLLLDALHAQFLESIMFYPLPIALLLYLIKLWHKNSKLPLCSENTEFHFRTFFSLHRTYWSWIMVAGSVTAFVLYLLSAKSIPFLKMDFVFSFGSFLLFLNYMSIIGYIVILAFLAQLSFFSLNLEALGLAVRSCLGSFNKKEICILKQIEEKNKSDGGFSKNRRLARLNWDFFYKLIIVVFLVAVLVAFDRSFQVFTPSLQTISTQNVSTELDVFRFWNNSFLYVVHVEKTYLINLPWVPNFLNLSLPNPSNLSISKGAQLVQSNEAFEFDVNSDEALSYGLMKDYDGAIQFVDVIPLSSSLFSKHVASLKLAYSDILDIQPISIPKPEPTETKLENGSIMVSLSFSINNTEPVVLSSNHFPLFQTGNYGNMTSFAWFENGIEKPSRYYENWNDWLSSYLYVSPHTFVNITVTATFEEKNQT